MKHATNVIQVVKLIDEFELPREAIPTQWLNEAVVWEALLERMPMTAMIRNLGKMTSLGLLAPFSDAKRLIVQKLRDETALKRARIHPLAVLVAQKTYAQGHGDKGALQWSPVTAVVDALDEAFYATFQNVEPCNKPVLLALDVSGSMAMSRIAGSCISAREGSAAMALITAATEPECEIIAFSAPARGGYGGIHGGGEPGITRVTVSPRMRLADVIQRIEAIPMGGTDCALPMLWAARNKLNVSAFVTYTDSETWAGNIHPAQGLRQYRNEFVGDAKAVVVGMTSNGFTLADPNDRGMLDVVGFDTTVPAVIADFVRSSRTATVRTVQGRQEANNAGGGECLRPLLTFPQRRGRITWLDWVVMKLGMRHRRFAVAKVTAIALLIAGLGTSASPLDPMVSTEREQATNDLRVLIETARIAWAYAEDKEDHFDVSLPRMLKEGNVAIANCRTKLDVVELFDEIVAGLKDGHASLKHPDLYTKGVRRGLPQRLVDTKEGVVLGKDLVISWNGRAMDEEIRQAARRAYASTPGQRRSLALKSLESGTADSSVRLKLKRPDGQITETNLTYHCVWPTEPFIAFRWLTNEIAYIRLTSFRAEAAAPELKDQGPKDPSGHGVAAVEAAKTKISEAFSRAAKARYLVLDLRGNGGGTDTLGSFVALHLFPGKFTYFKLQTRFSPQLRAVQGFETDPTNGWSQAFEWGPDRPASVTPFSGFICVLQDERCFSTTDNLLACMQDLVPADRIRFIGRPSGGGTGAPRALVTLPWSKATVTLTVMKVFSPKGRLIEGRGTIPDRRVEWAWTDVLNGRDADLEAALDEVNKRTVR